MLLLPAEGLGGFVPHLFPGVAVCARVNHGSLGTARRSPGTAPSEPGEGPASSLAISSPGAEGSALLCGGLGPQVGWFLASCYLCFSRFR